MTSRRGFLKICYFPGRESCYARTRIIIKGLKAVGVKVYDCSSANKNFLRYIKGFLKFLFYKNRSDVILVGFLGHFIIPIVKLFTNKKILFDAFLSIYQTLAYDRGTISPIGIFGKIARFIDRKACQLSDIVFLDTEEHIRYFTKEIGIDRAKLRHLPVGSDDSIMYPRPDSGTEEFVVHFHGEFQPLHGVIFIIEAARLLPGVMFQLIGYGRCYKDCLKRVNELKLRNVIFIKPVPYEELPDYISRASVCLGIFGNTRKANMVIPHKVYEALAMRKPLVTADTPACREILVDGKNCLFCKPADPESLAECICRLKDNISLRKMIAENGYTLFKTAFTPSHIGRHILNTLVTI